MINAGFGGAAPPQGTSVRYRLMVGSANHGHQCLVPRHDLLGAARAACSRPQKASLETLAQTAGEHEIWHMDSTMADLH